LLLFQFELPEPVELLLFQFELPEPESCSNEDSFCGDDPQKYPVEEINVSQFSLPIFELIYCYCIHLI
jgi:hypothetical protein